MKCMTADVSLEPVQSVELVLPLMLGTDPALPSSPPILTSIRPFPRY